jgi:hypothetical protein
MSTINESFTLPSKGLIYDKPINPNITLRSMTTMEEMKRLSPSDTPYKLMADIIEDCITSEKLGMKIYDLCLGDYQYLLHKLRTVTYGTEYKMIITCPHCGQIVDSTADLDTLDVMEYDDTYLDLINITLPVTGKLIELKYQTPRDLDIVSFKKREMQRKTKSNLDYSLLFTTISLIKKVDGQVLNPVALEEFVKKLPMKDISFILAEAEKLNGKVGVDNSITATCGQCGNEVVTSFRITSEFFGPTNY